MYSMKSHIMHTLELIHYLFGQGFLAFIAMVINCVRIEKVINAGSRLLGTNPFRSTISHVLRTEHVRTEHLMMVTETYWVVELQDEITRKFYKKINKNNLHLKELKPLKNLESSVRGGGYLQEREYCPTSAKKKDRHAVMVPGDLVRFGDYVNTPFGSVVIT